MISYILAVACGVILLALDQITKYLVTLYFTLYESKEFLNGFIDLVYIHNRGGAWGILSGRTWVLLLITTLLILVCGFVLVKYSKNKLIFWSMCLVLSGGLGNMIDRIFRNGNVVDFLHFEFFPTFPVFNIADCAVVVGAGLLIFYYIIDIIKEKNEKN